ncbi:MAG: hypothetical protein HN509_01890 [Halobacteriovoraceae bacterium]|jgi:hypothetical protein|nr:hypothetical protein [Halobacteriovoraceae bacterium]MBT5094876.1 hypothetical protein [Halobacteriovoraceae bacterium]
MKTLITMLALLVATNVFAGTGTKFFTTKIDGANEAQIVANAEAIIPSLIEGDYKPALREMRWENCWPIKARYIKVQSLTVSKSYKNEAGKLMEVFTGRLRYSHKSCQEDRD